MRLGGQKKLEKPSVRCSSWEGNALRREQSESQLTG